MAKILNKTRVLHLSILIMILVICFTFVTAYSQVTDTISGSFPATTNGITAKYGIKITMINYSASLDRVDKSGGGCNVSYLLDSSKAILATSNTFSGTAATFPSPYTMIQGNSYYIVCDAQGSAWNVNYNNAYSFPAGMSSFNVTAGYDGSSDSGTTIWEIQTVYTTQVDVSAPVNITISLQKPDNAATLNNMTVNFTANLIPTSGNLTNATLYVWFSNTSLNFTAFNIVTGNVTNSTNWTQNMADGDYIYNVYGCAINATATKCNFDANRTFTINTNPWFSPAYDKCFSFNVTGAEENISYIPFYVSLNATSYPSINTTSWGNLRFVSSSCNNSGTEMNAFLESNTTLKGNFYIGHSLDKGLNQFSIYISSNKSITSNFRPDLVTRDYDNFYTFSEGSGNFSIDWASGNNLTANMSSFQWVNSSLGLGLNTTNLACGVSWKNQTADLTGDTNRSIFAFAKRVGSATDLHGDIVSIGWADTNMRFAMRASDGGDWVLAANGAGDWDTGVPIDNNYNFHAINHFANGVINQWFKNATFLANTTVTYSTVSSRIAIGGAYFTDFTCVARFNGTIDEARISNKTFSSAYINRTYQNLNSSNIQASSEFSPLSLTINSPSNQSYNTTIIKFNATAISSSGVDSCWVTLNSGATNYSLTNTTIGEIYNYTNNSISQGSSIAIFSCNDTLNNIVSKNVTFFIDSINPSISIINPATAGIFMLNGTNISLNFVPSDLNLQACWYSLNDGTNTTLINCQNGSFLSNSAGKNNLTLYANDTAGNIISNSTYFYGVPTFSQCTSSINTNTLNISFIDETTLQNINATIDSSTFYYWVQDNLNLNSTYTFSSSAMNSSFTFCIYPSTAVILSNYEIKYSSTMNGTYPQRTYNVNSGIFSNSMTSLVLSLLRSTDGQYVTFQVVSPGLQAISGVSIVAQRTVDGVLTNVASGVTDNSGTIAMWLNPLYSHTITFSKDGYVTKTETITPSQSAYTIILNAVSSGGTGGSGGSGSTIDYGGDINYFIKPAQNYLNTSLNYLFQFGINSTSLTIAQYGFNITNSSGFIVASNFSSGNYGNVTYSLNTGLNDTFIMNAYWIVNTTTTYTNKVWYINNGSDTEFSIANLGKDLNSYANSGMFGLSPFALAIICFLIIFITCGIISYSFGIYSPTAIAGIAIGMSILFTYLNLLQSPVGAVPYFIPLILGIVGIVIAWREFA